MSGLAGEAVITGVGTTSHGELERNEYSLAGEVLSRALVDRGIRQDEIDGLVVCGIPSYARAGLYEDGETLGINSCWTLGLPNNGPSSTIGIIEAAVATSAGFYDRAFSIEQTTVRARAIC